MLNSYNINPARLSTPAPSRCHSPPTWKTSTLVQSRRSRTVQVSASISSSDAPSLQLATAKLPSASNVDTFSSNLYQWASTLTTNGRNMPFALPIKTDPIKNGFSMSLLRVVEKGEIAAVAVIKASVEPVASDNVLFIRLYEGPASNLVLGEKLRKSGNVNERLTGLLNACVDIPLVMNSMPPAIRKAAMVSS